MHKLQKSKLSLHFLTNPLGFNNCKQLISTIQAPLVGPLSWPRTPDGSMSYCGCPQASWRRGSSPDIWAGQVFSWGSHRAWSWTPRLRTWSYLSTPWGEGWTILVRSFGMNLLVWFGCFEHGSCAKVFCTSFPSWIHLVQCLRSVDGFHNWAPDLPKLSTYILFCIARSFFALNSF